MRLRVRIAVLASLGLAIGACTSDLPAPDNHNNQPEDGDIGPDTGMGGELSLDCANPSLGAVDAEYEHQVDGSGGIGPYFWTAQDLPPGLAIDGNTGIISGTPEEEGSFTVTLSAEDNSDPVNTGTIQCTIDVNPRFDVDPPDTGDGHLPCIVKGDDVREMITAGTGDGSDVTCQEPSRNKGNGTMPDGVSVGADCLISGAPTGEHAERYGTWSWIMEVVQSGVVRHVPYCISTTPNPGNYDIKVFRDGDQVTDTALVPFTGTFDTTGDFDFGADDDSNPRFDVVSPSDCAPNACFFGFFFFATSSPFDINQTRFNDSQLLRDMADNPIGFTHGFETAGDGPIDPDYMNRPWVLDINVTYCIADNEGGPADDDGPCEGKDNVLANGENEFQVSVIMRPEQG